MLARWACCSGKVHSLGLFEACPETKLDGQKRTVIDNRNTKDISQVAVSRYATSRLFCITWHKESYQSRHSGSGVTVTRVVHLRIFTAYVLPASTARRPTPAAGTSLHARTAANHPTIPHGTPSGTSRPIVSTRWLHPPLRHRRRPSIPRLLHSRPPPLNEGPQRICKRRCCQGVEPPRELPPQSAWSAASCPSDETHSPQTRTKCASSQRRGAGGTISSSLEEPSEKSSAAPPTRSTTSSCASSGRDTPEKGAPRATPPTRGRAALT